jgi:hypothetical protein
MVMAHEREESAQRGGLFRGAFGFLNHPLHFEWSCANLAWLLVAIGVILRVWEYLEFRTLYMDEHCLLKNIVGKSIFEFQKVLEDDQMAPPGFLVIERLLVHLPLQTMLAGRLFPLVCGIASVFLTYSVAKRFLDPRAVPLAVGMVAFGDHLLYYSAEIKQYSCDLMFALLALLFAAPRPPARMSPRRFLALGVFGLIAPWFSFPVVFVLAGVGLHLIVTETTRKDYRRAGIAVGMSLLWLLSFGACFLLSRSILSKRDFIWVWWNFAFLPLPPRSMADVSLVTEAMANVFINPASVLTPLSLPYTALLASVLALIGCVSLGRRWPGGLFLLISPLVLALAASALHQYPFHGRLVLYLVPTYLLLLAEGAAAVGRPTGWLVTLVLAGFLLYGEAAEILWYKAIQGRSRPFDTHGDLKNDLLDYLEYHRWRALRLPPVEVKTPEAARSEPPP